MADSKALARQKKHSRPGAGSRNEGIWLSLDHLETLIQFLRTDPNAVSQGINSVAFMIGKMNMPAEYTIEVFPFNKTGRTTGTFMTDSSGTKTGILEIPGFPISNEGGGAGGNQKTPPPST